MQPFKTNSSSPIIPASVVKVGEPVQVPVTEYQAPRCFEPSCFDPDKCHTHHVMMNCRNSCCRHHPDKVIAP